MQSLLRMSDGIRWFLSTYKLTSTASGTWMHLACVNDILDISGLMDIPDWDCVHFRVVGLTYILDSRD